MSDRNGTAEALWTSEEAVRATGGVNGAPWRASGVSIDTRSLVPGDLFVALVGPNHDGHDYVETALSAGAAAALVSEPVTASNVGAPLLRVENTEDALRDLARAARARTDAKICAVTGSVGKTGTKELLAAALGAGGPVTATQGNLNNHFGLPLSLARMPSQMAFGVFEMGMNHAGEISPLSQLARPHVAMITTIAPVHIEFFEDIYGIVEAKAEIFDGLADGGDAVVNADQPYYDRLIERARAAGAGRVLSFGEAENADARLVSYRIDGDGTHVEAMVDGAHVAYRLGLRGQHWAMNSLGVLAAAVACGIDVHKAAARLCDVEPPKGRGRVEHIQTRTGPANVIDETYNASPVAVRAAIDLLSDTETGRGGRRIVVLGDMLELGTRTEEEHLGLASALVDAGVEQVFVCGQYMSDLLDALPPEMQGGRATTAAKLAPMICDAARGGDLILVKGSAGARMGDVVRELTSMNGEVH